MTDIEKMKYIWEAASKWHDWEIGTGAALSIIGNIIHPQKPTPDDINWAERRLEELEEKDNG